MKDTRFAIISFWIIGIFVLLILLYFRLLESLGRGYNPDEFYHLHYVYLLTQGKLPYRDFFNIYSPIFHIILYPIFKILGENFLALTISRVIIFSYFLIGLIFTYLIAKIISSRKIALLAVVIAAAMPMAIEKAIEVRPDNLMTMLVLGGIYFAILGMKTKKIVNYFFSGILLMLSFLVLSKIVFTIGGFVLGVLIFTHYSSSEAPLGAESRSNIGKFSTRPPRADFARTIIRLNNYSKYIKGLFAFFIGAGIVLFIFLFTLARLNILDLALKSIYIYSRMAVGSLRFGNELNPFFWFLPNDAIFGTYRGIAWYTNCFLLILSLIGIVTSYLKLRKGRDPDRWLVFAPMIASFAYLFLVFRPFQQYLLPYLIFVPFWTAFGLVDCLDLANNYILSSRPSLKGAWRDLPHSNSWKIPRLHFVSLGMTKFWRFHRYIFTVAFFLLLVLSMWQSWQVKRWWSDYQDKKFINFILANTKEDDVIWGPPSYVFRQDGYYDFSGKLAETPTGLVKIFPDFIPMLEERNTRYLVISSEALKKRWWPFDQYDTKEIADWIEKNYQETEYPGLWVKKE